MYGPIELLGYVLCLLKRAGGPRADGATILVLCGRPQGTHPGPTAFREHYIARSSLGLAGVEVGVEVGAEVVVETEVF